MTATPWRLTLAGMAAVGIAAATHAQNQKPDPAPPVGPVVKFPGGHVVLAGPDVIVRTPLSGGRSMNVITGSGNGVGNRIVVGGAPGTLTLVRNSRNGFGNKLIVDPDDMLIDVDALLAGVKAGGLKFPVPGVRPVTPALPPADPPCYKGKEKAFWTKKMFSDRYDCNLYWCPTTKLWFRYAAEDDTYRPVAAQPHAPEK